MLKKIGVWLFMAFLVFFVVTQPEGAAHVAKGIGGGLLLAANGIGNFFSNLVS